MDRPVTPPQPTRRQFPKCPTGIDGLDEITGGGLPRSRPTLICGGPGCGKTLFALEFLINGALRYGEPGVFLAFEENAEDLAQNVVSLGFDLDDLIARNLLSVDYVHVERSEIEETGEYDLEALFIRLAYAVDSVGAKRVALDTLETLFGGLSNEGILRAEIRRLFRWIKDRDLTTIVTAERGEGSLTRQGLEEYVSDCVITLDHRVTDQMATRRIRVVKYRGSTHGTNEYPFLIDAGGIDVLPITSVGLDHDVSSERISSGIPRLDTMLGGDGYYRGSSVLVSGTAGTGKSTLAATFADAACRRGERAMVFAFEESRPQIVRNMKSVGIDLEPWITQGLLRFYSARPTTQGLEAHLATMYKHVRDFQPSVVVIDPITNFLSIGSLSETRAMLMRMVDFLKSRRVTGLFTSLTHGHQRTEETDVGISSLIDTWLLLRDIESNGERNRGLYVLKSRGMAHSNQIHEFRVTSRGIELLDVYIGSEGLLTGSARLAIEAREREAALRRSQEIERKQRELEQRRAALDARIAELRASFAAEEQELLTEIEQDQAREQNLAHDRREISQRRQADGGPASNGNRQRKEVRK
jgi:circadian clock protein KaiC